MEDSPQMLGIVNSASNRVCMSRNLSMCNPVRGLYGTIDINIALVPPEKHGLNLCIWLHPGWVRAANCILHIFREDFE